MDKLSELAKEDFGIDLQDFVNKQITSTFEHLESGSHDNQIVSIIEYYWDIRGCMPQRYRSKSGCIVDKTFMGYCEDLPYEYEDGIIENICLFLEKQVWEIIISSLTGSYRSAIISLRHLLQLSCWVLQSIINKQVLTNQDEDQNNAMSLNEFEIFLEQNYVYYQKKKKIIQK